MEPKLTFFHVSKSDAESLPHLAQQYQDLRLTALQLSASSFSSTYEIESQHPPAYWQSQILNSEQELFICSAETDSMLSDDPVNSTTTTVTQKQPQTETWVAQVILRGPILPDKFRLPPAAGQIEIPPSAASTEYWQLKGLYVNPTYRNRAISQRLITYAITWLQKSASIRSINNLRIRAMVRPDNVASQRLFQKIGFVRNGTCTLREAGLANGEIRWEDRENEFPEHYDRRGGHIYVWMER